jgi:hypothetical protein
MRLSFARARTRALRLSICARQRLAVWTLGLCLCLGGAQQAHAQAQAPAHAGAPASTAATDAKEAFRRGEAAYSAGNYEVAIREWNSAYQADPRPRIQFNLSQAYERMGQLEDAIRALESFLNSGDPDDPTYSDANARLVALRQRLSSTGVVVSGGADGGQILVDETDWGRTPRPDKITVSPGNHALVIRWANGREFRTNVFVPAGQVAQVMVPADAAGPAAAGPVAGTGSQPGAAPAQHSPDRRVLWYSLGGGAAAVGVGLLAYGIARKLATSDCDGSKIYCNPDDVDRADRQAIAGLVTGSVLMAAGAALFVVGAITHNHSDTQARTQCGIGYASAACRFQF